MVDCGILYYIDGFKWLKVGINAPQWTILGYHDAFAHISIHTLLQDRVSYKNTRRSHS